MVVDKDFIEIQDRLIEVRRRHAVINTIFRAIEHKRASLENLVKLFLNNYYAEPHIPKEAKDAVDTNTKESINRQINETMRRRRE
jgi:hypothetical protein